MSMSTQSFLGLIKYKNTLGLATLGFGTVQGRGAAGARGRPIPGYFTCLTSRIAKYAKIVFQLSVSHYDCLKKN